MFANSHRVLNSAIALVLRTARLLGPSAVRERELKERQTIKPIKRSIYTAHLPIKRSIPNPIKRSIPSLSSNNRLPMEKKPYSVYPVFLLSLLGKEGIDLFCDSPASIEWVATKMETNMNSPTFCQPFSSVKCFVLCSLRVFPVLRCWPASGLKHLDLQLNSLHSLYNNLKIS